MVGGGQWWGGGGGGGVGTKNSVFLAAPLMPQSNSSGVNFFFNLKFSSPYFFQ